MMDLYLPPQPAIIRPNNDRAIFAVLEKVAPARRDAFLRAIERSLRDAGIVPPVLASHFMFGAAPAGGTLTETLVADGVGTQIKTFTDQSGTAFDGTTSKDSNAAAYGTPSTHYYGKTWASAKTISKVQVWPASNTGFSFTGDPSITIYGKNGSAPSGATDGTSIHATGTFTDQTTMKEMTIASPTAYDHNWVVIGGTTQVYIAQIRFYELA